MKRDALAALAANRYWSEADGRAALAAWRASGTPLAAFADRHGLGAARLVRWHRRLEPSPRATPMPPTGFASVELITGATDAVTICVGAIEIVAPNASPAWVAALVRALAGAA